VAGYSAKRRDAIVRKIGRLDTEFVASGAARPSLYAWEPGSVSVIGVQGERRRRTRSSGVSFSRLDNVAGSAGKLRNIEPDDVDDSHGPIRTLHQVATSNERTPRRERQSTVRIARRFHAPCAAKAAAVLPQTHGSIRLLLGANRTATTGAAIVHCKRAGGG
jgi:hypothetical protein